MTEAPCPDINTLRAILDERDPEGGDEVLGHLEHCTLCQDSLQTLAGDSGAWRFTAAGLKQAEYYEPALRDAMDRLEDQDIFASDGDIPDAYEDLSYLQPTDKPGVLGLLGNYEVQEKIGRGGMGIVLKATDPALNRTVALKVLAPALATSPTARKRFVREGRAAARVVHDHIVTVHGVQEAGGLPFLIMQYVEGESLQERLEREGPLELVEIVRIAQQAASGLAAAHAQGLIHRDIKPANLLLEVPRNAGANADEGRVRITDFGLARMADDAQVTQHGMVIGTPEYMAPEQARSEPLDQRADLFSLGSVIYAMCTGRPPFCAATTVAVIRQLCDDTPVPVRSLNPDVPGWLETLTERLMRKNPEERIQQASEVATLLTGFLAHEREPGTPAPILPAARDKARGPVRRRLWLAACILLALVPVALWLCGLIPDRLKKDMADQRAHAVVDGKKDDPVPNPKKGKPPDKAPAPPQLTPPTPQQARALEILKRLGARYQSDVPGLPVVHVVLQPGTDVDGILEDLLPLTEIANLSLQGTKITDAGMKYLPGFRKMHQLYLGQTAISDAGVKELAQCEQLAFLGLENTHVTDAGIKAIANLKNLQYFNVGGTGITDASLKDIGAFHQMGFLCLYSTAVTDAGMKELQGLTRLHTLLINDTDVTDAGLKDLASLPLLRKINAKNTPITDEGLKALQEGMPGAKVEWEPRGGPAGGHGWLAAAAGVALVIAFAAGIGGLLRRRQNAGKALAAPNQIQEGTPPATPLPLMPAARDKSRGPVRRRLWLAAAILLALVPVALWSCGLIPAKFKNEPADQPAWAADDYPNVFYHDFRGRPLPPELTLFNVDKDDVLQLEPEGARIRIPNTWIHPGGGVGFITTFGIKGDFEATATIQILHADVPPTGYGVGVEMYAVRDGHGVGVSRLLRPDGQQVVLWCTLNLNGVYKWVDVAPCTDTIGRLRLRRTGTTMSCLWASGTQGQNFVEKHHLEFGSEDIESIRLTGLTSCTPSKLDARLLDFQVRWRPESSAGGLSRTWLLVALLVGVAVLIAFAAGIAGLLRKGQHAAKALSTTDQSQRDTPSATPLPPPLLFRCPACQHKLRVKAERAGKLVKCPCCGSAVLVPGIQAQMPPSTAVQAKPGRA